ncbi:MAG: hypothetical protein V3U75_04080 [Methylococcaceae bacterium]
MKLKDLSDKELCDLSLDITNEFAERFHRDPGGHADEFVAIREMELAADTLRKSLEQSGRIK